MLEALRKKTGYLQEEESIRELLQFSGVKNEVLNFLFDGDKSIGSQGRLCLPQVKAVLEGRPGMKAKWKGGKSTDKLKYVELLENGPVWACHPVPCGVFITEDGGLQCTYISSRYSPFAKDRPDITEEVYVDVSANPIGCIEERMVEITSSREGVNCYLRGTTYAEDGTVIEVTHATFPCERDMTQIPATELDTVVSRSLERPKKEEYQSQAVKKDYSGDEWQRVLRNFNNARKTAENQDTGKSASHR